MSSMATRNSSMTKQYSPEGNDDYQAASRREAIVRAAASIQNEAASDPHSRADFAGDDNVDRTTPIDDSNGASMSGDTKHTSRGKKPPASPMVTPPTAGASGVSSPVAAGAASSAAAAASSSSPVSPQRRGVPHVYHDCSQFPDPPGYVRKKTGGVTQPFPEKLYEMLESEGDSEVVHWLPHGRAFLVRQPQRFIEEIMPKVGVLLRFQLNG